MKTGTIPLATLAVLFGIIQIWWIALTLKNGREAEQVVKERRQKKIENQKEFLEKILKK